MKLSKQERIAVLIIAVIVILGAGIFLFIVPKFNDIEASNNTLASKKQELEAVESRRALKDPLYDRVMDAYHDGQSIADMFFTEMTAYQADNETRAFLAQCKEKGLNIVVDSLSIGNPGTKTLSVNFYDESVVSYPLKEYATQGVAATEEELAAQFRENTLRSALSESQTVGAIEVNFMVTALDPETLLAFADAVNDYQKTENGTKIRKAVMLDSLSYEYGDIVKEYEEQIKEMEDEIDEQAIRELYIAAGLQDQLAERIAAMEAEKAAQEEIDRVNAELNGENLMDKEGPGALSDNIWNVNVRLTFYSIERMQNPQDQLDAQEGFGA